MHAPASAWERRKHGQASQEAQQPSTSPAAVLSLSQHNRANSSFIPEHLAATALTYSQASTGHAAKVAVSLPH